METKRWCHFLNDGTAAAVRGAEGKQCAPQQLTRRDEVFCGADREKARGNVPDPSGALLAFYTVTLAHVAV